MNGEAFAANQAALDPDITATLGTARTRTARAATKHIHHQINTNANMFLGNGRKALLEFLRNLTPQILFLTIALISAASLDLNKPQWDWDGLRNVLPSVACLLIFIGATIANMTTFVEAALESNEELDKEVAAIRARNLKPYRLTTALLFAALKHNKPAFAKVTLSVIIAEFALVAVFITAIQGAIASPLLHR